MSFLIGGPFDGVSKSSRFRDIALSAYWGHEFDLNMPFPVGGPLEPSLYL